LKEFVEIIKPTFSVNMTKEGMGMTAFSWGGIFVCISIKIQQVLGCSTVAEYSASKYKALVQSQALKEKKKKKHWATEENTVAVSDMSSGFIASRN
jgi:uncharacterized protein YceK